MSTPPLDPFAALLAAVSALGSERALIVLQGAIRDAEHAREYRATAGVFRRKATRATTDEQQRELEERAAYFEARGARKADGRPMPRALRTPLESLEHVDDLRRRLVDVALLVGDAETGVDDAELRAFIASLTRTSNGEPSVAAVPPIADLRAVVLQLAQALGARLDREGVELAPFRSPLDAF
jgi:hypothetical protein